ncbi:hypothetical protein JGS22_008295 [Streptomyces sp. P38-E01]|uniref:Secreted protein n=1 Tax=Streptomyces tardus TaxID=2780544 RepID=A0A949N7N6_9ACTN|nr:hypothetical protein [Streptomyces tardus]MBU7597621.1 hypothetical protein [Streptomyces tardus]
MARTRTARVIAAVAAVPLAAAMFTGVAHADNGAIAADDSRATVVSTSGSGFGDDSAGNAITNQQLATAPGSSNTANNQANSANVIGSGVTVIDQDNTTIVFSPLW